MEKVISRERKLLIKLLENKIKIYWGNEKYDNLYVERGNVKVRYPVFNYDFIEVDLLILDILEATEPSRNSLNMKHKNKNKKKKGKCNGTLVYSSSIIPKKKFANINVSEKKRDIRKNLIDKGIIFNF